MRQPFNEHFNKLILPTSKDNKTEYYTKKHEFNHFFMNKPLDTFNAQKIVVPLSEMENVINYYENGYISARCIDIPWVKISKREHHDLITKIKDEYYYSHKGRLSDFIKRDGFNELYKNSNLIGVWGTTYTSDYCDIEASRMDAVVSSDTHITIYRTCYCENHVFEGFIESLFNKYDKSEIRHY